MTDSKELVEDLLAAAKDASQRLNYAADLWDDQGLLTRAKADWNAAQALDNAARRVRAALSTKEE